MNDKKRPSVGIYTLGCKVNQYESEAIAERCSTLGFDILPPSDVCDAYIINTCTVTAESDRKARQFIRRAISKNPSAYIAVCGCFAQVSPKSIEKIEGVDVIIGNTQKLSCADKIAELYARGTKNTCPEMCISPIADSDFERMSIRHFDRTRAYIKIEDGCESHCAYCIIPNARGRIRSKPLSDVLCEIEYLTLGGCHEVVLTGIETASYGRDLGGIDLGDLLCRANMIEGVGRIRLGSLDPSLIKPDFVRRIASLEHLAPHFHLSLQSGSSSVLARMRRKYNAEQAMRAIELLRENIPNVNFSTDVIVGFPGEDAREFSETAEFLRRAEFLGVHIFPYSKRVGTPAASMCDQISNDIKSERLHVLEAIAAQTRATLLERACREQKHQSVLFETYSNGYAVGHTPSFFEVAVKSDRPLRGEVHNVYITENDGSRLLGKICNAD